MTRADRTALPAVLVGTGLWLTALLTISVLRGPEIPEVGVWWWGVTAMGTTSGALGLMFLLRRRRRILG